jgi:hypothetical protein
MSVVAGSLRISSISGTARAKEKVVVGPERQAGSASRKDFESFFERR